MTATSIAHLRIKLDHVEPVVVRRLEVPLTIRLDRLHLVLQAAMGWTNSHLYEIRARLYLQSVSGAGNRVAPGRVRHPSCSVSERGCVRCAN